MAVNKNRGSRDDNRGKFRGPEPNRFGGPGAEPPGGIPRSHHGKPVEPPRPGEPPEIERGGEEATRPGAVSPEDLAPRTDRGDTRK